MRLLLMAAVEFLEGVKEKPASSDCCWSAGSFGTIGTWRAGLIKVETSQMDETQTTCNVHSLHGGHQAARPREAFPFPKSMLPTPDSHGPTPHCFGG
jgi:hypothetical protein